MTARNDSLTVALGLGGIASGAVARAALATGAETTVAVVAATVGAVLAGLSAYRRSSRGTAAGG